MIVRKASAGIVGIVVVTRGMDVCVLLQFEGFLTRFFTKCGHTGRDGCVMRARRLGARSRGRWRGGWFKNLSGSGRSNLIEESANDVGACGREGKAFDPLPVRKVNSPPSTTKFIHVLDGLRLRHLL